MIIFIFLMLLYFISNTAARILVRVFTRTTNLDPYTASLALVSPMYVFGAIYGLLINSGPLLSGVTAPLLALALMFGFIEIIIGKLSVLSQKHVDVATFTVLRMVTVPTSVLFSAVFFRETLSAIQLFGMAFILTGVSVVGANGKVPRMRHFGKYELLTMLNGVYLAVFIMANKFLIDQTSLSTLMVIFSGVTVLPNMLFVLKRRRSKPSRRDLALVSASGVASVIHIVAFWSAVELIGNVALVSSLSAFRIVTVFIGGYVVLKERENVKQKIAGSILAFAGMAIS